MVIVTTFHIDAARDRIINCVNDVRNIVANQVVPATRKLGAIETTLESFKTETIAGLTNISDCVSLLRNLRSETTSNFNALLNRYVEPVGQAQTQWAQGLGEPEVSKIEERTFFSNLDTALNSTQALLNHVPPARYTLPPASLPVNELFGQLHALHLNTLEWLTHINHNLDSMLNMLNPVNLMSQGTPLSRLRDAVRTLTQDLGSIKSDQQKILASISTIDHSDILHKLDSLDTGLRQLGIRLDVVVSSLNHMNERPPNASHDIASSSAATDRNPLPLYQAVHPSLFCRTYGNILYNGVDSRIPMDITGRPASTSLKLTITVDCSEQSTKVNFTLLDDGYILLSDSIETKHKLQHIPSDCLSLIHARCPKFVYKFRGEGLC
uniref:Non-structural protein n=1 Tax=Shallot virus X TaxID=31770 RepID=Q88457_SHVX|nr:non-structural protein [Shallot virus X]